MSENIYTKYIHKIYLQGEIYIIAICKEDYKEMCKIGLIKDRPYSNFKIANKRHGKSKTYYVEDDLVKKYKKIKETKE
jgi:hypothetical protein